MCIQVMAALDEARAELGRQRDEVRDAWRARKGEATRAAEISDRVTLMRAYLVAQARLEGAELAWQAAAQAYEEAEAALSVG